MQQNTKQLIQILDETLNTEMLRHEHDIKISDDTIYYDMKFKANMYTHDPNIPLYRVSLSINLSTIDNLKFHEPKENVKTILSYIAYNNLCTLTKEYIKEYQIQNNNNEEYINSIIYMHELAEMSLQTLIRDFYDNLISKYKDIIKDDLLGYYKV